jgi:Flp pilus assembly protein TadG
VRNKRNEGGVALVEFALALPFLTVLVFGTIDLGRMYLTWIQVKNAAREGANFARIHPLWQTNAPGCADPNNVTYRAASEASNTFTVSVTPPATGGCDVSSSLASGTAVTVRVSTSFKPLTPFITAIVGNPTVAASVTVSAQKTL